jgi:hypothetical protein
MKIVVISLLLASILVTLSCSRNGTIHRQLRTPRYSGRISCPRDNWTAFTNAVCKMERQLSSYIQAQPLDTFMGYDRQSNAEAMTDLLANLPVYVRWYIGDTGDTNTMFVFFASPEVAELTEDGISGSMYADGGGYHYFQVQYSMISNRITEFSVNCPE